MEMCWPLRATESVTRSPTFLVSRYCVSASMVVIEWPSMAAITSSLAATVEQRAAGVPGVDRRVGLDHAGERPSVGSGRAAIQAGDDAGRERTLQAERRLDGERGVADLQAVGVAQG